jgi:hypothetical protein
MSVFGAGDYDRKKKKFQSSVWRVVDYDLKNKSSSHLSGGLSVFGAGDYDRKKKKFQSSVWPVVDYDLKKKKFQSSVWRVVSFWCWRLRV